MSEGKAAMWTLIGVAVSFKLLGAALILYYDHSQGSVAFVAATHWPFLLPVLLLAAPLLYWWRLVRVRAKRHKLIEAEWRIDAPQPVKPDR